MSTLAVKNFYQKIFSIVFIIIFLNGCTPLGEGSDLGGKIPVLVWSTDDPDQGDVKIGETISISFTLANNGQASAISCKGITLSDTVNFSVISDNCNSPSLLPNQSCQVEIAAHPQSPGYKELTITRECADDVIVQSSSSQVSVNAVAPSLALSPLTFDFGDLYVGTNSSVQAFTFSNSGTAEATGCGVATLSNSTDFSISADTCASANSSIGASCLVSVLAQPATVGLKSTTLSRSCTFGGVTSTTTNQIVVNSQSAILAWSPLTYDFGSVTIGTQSVLYNFVINNSGDAQASNCSAPTISDTTNFSISFEDCGTNPLAAGLLCNVEVIAEPQTIGVKTATLSRTCTEGGTVTTTANQITVTGTGLPNLSWSPQTHSFGNVEIGSNSTAQSFTLSNSGPVAATGCSAPVIDDTTHFTIVSDTCSTNNVSASGSCTIEVRANPTTVGAKATTVSRMCTVGGVATTTTNQITTTGINPAPILAWSPLTYDFGSVTSGTNTSNTTLTLSNTGTGPATGCSAPTISDTTNFTIVSNTCGTADVAAAATCQVVLRGHPMTDGIKTSTLSRVCTVGGTVTTTTNEIKVRGLSQDWQQEFNLTTFNSVRSGGASNSFKYYFRNPSSMALTGCGSPTLSNSADYNIVSTTCGATMAAGTLCEALVQATPTSTGAVTSTLSRTCNETGSVSTTLNASGSAASTTATKVSLGTSHGCALISDGTVKCWSSSQLTPTLVSGITTATAIASGTNHNCVLLSDSTINCWGTNSSGQLGDGTTTDRTAPVVVSGISTATAIVAGGSFSCALLSDSTIKCWGMGSSGQLGDNGGTQRTTPVFVSGISTATTIAAGGTFACAILTGGSMRCWGANGWGTIGDGTNTQRNIPANVSGVTTAIAIGAGDNHTCVILSGGTMRCWGYNNAGQLGDGTTTNRNAPTAVTGITTAASIVGGSSFTCARLSTNNIRCWGSNTEGQLGNETGVNSLTSVSVSGISTATSLAAGNRKACAALSSGIIKCWGYAAQLGDGTLSDRTSITTSSLINNIISIGTGEATSCAVVTGGTVRCWGVGSSGQLGQGSLVSSSTPVTVSGITTATSVAVGAIHACAVLADTTARCWGSNGNGRLGDGTTTNRTSPVAVTGLSGISKIAAGLIHTCALMLDGTVKCWGMGGNGELGNSTTTSSSSYVSVTGVANAIWLALGTNYACAVISDGTIKCWGAGGFAQLGEGTAGGNRSTPITVSGITNATSVTLGYTHGCASLSDGTVKCWGVMYTSSSGQLGNGTTSGSTTPVVVSGISNATAVYGGYNHICATLSDNKVKCWGSNVSGQLGDGTYTNRTTPVYRLNESSPLTMSSGGNSYYQCSIDGSNNLVCSGRNLNCQAGYNEFTIRTVSGL